MIYSDKQYGISTNQLGKFKEALLIATEQETEDKWARKIEIDALKNQIAELEAELVHYDLLKSGEITLAKSHSLETLPSTLIQARIARGLSQSDLAEALDIEPQQVQRYEASEYMGANLAEIIEAANILNVHTAGLFETEATHRGMVISWENADNVCWQKFPAKEMVSRGWYDIPRDADPIEAIKKYFFRAAGSHFASALHRKKMRGENPPNEYALLAWQVRVLERARAQIKESDLPPFELDDRWLPDLVALTRRKDGPKRARNLLARKGIALVMEEHLQGTYLDGAAMLAHGGRPVIGLTLRYDRTDNFWFVLFHELGHVFLHLFDGIRYDFFDDDTSKAHDTIEGQADEFALNTLIPEEKWEQCLSRFALSEEAVRIDAKRLNIDESIIAGRIRKEQGNYVILNNLIRSGVREQLKEVYHDPE